MRRWRGAGSTAAVVTAVVVGSGLTEQGRADPGVSLPGPEYMLSMTLPPDLAADRLEFDAPESADESEAGEVVGRGEASYYGAGFAGRPTANGERFDPGALTAAHPSLPFGTQLRVTNEANGKQVTVRVNDRGPFAKDRIIDLSEGAARQIGMVQSGTANVTIERM